MTNRVMEFHDTENEFEQMSLFANTFDFKEHKKYLAGKFKSKDEIIAEMKEMGKTNIYHVLSFGGGTQSAHLLEEYFRGEIHYDYIVFSDTGAEPQFIHEQVKWWQKRQKEFNNNTPFIVTHHSSMPGGLEEMLFRYIYTDYQRFQMPVYCNSLDETSGEEVPAGIMPRQCTVDFKIVPVKQAVRKLVMQKLGLKVSQRIPKAIGFIIDIGFSFDEINRVNLYQSPQFNYMYLAYPLIEQGLTTNESIKFLQDNGSRVNDPDVISVPLIVTSLALVWTGEKSSMMSLYRF
ncbi:hypothetical protein [Cytobacillus purgationiresistens]|uniref:Uncharacterized protein n=1 Tax=Cytobacillus purgationiresistens TaxID=863449 RepID=A0ABU0APY1_9BACI|nr:hypothetical protein [Cytobacillus purgationiresistens]MDQ0273346.1 hypothetical protein [Cytobacillus purgationiresistens]